MSDEEKIDLEDMAEDATVTEIISNSGLAERQAAFAREFCIDHNATKATIRAGYSKNGASVQGTRLLANAKIAKTISKIRTAKAMALEFSKDDVIGAHVEICLLYTSDAAAIRLV